MKISCRSLPLQWISVLWSFALMACCGVLHAETPIVVIDAGHGGSKVVDNSSPNNASYRSAALGKTILEKDLTLEMANEVIRLINQSGKVKALATRTTDENIGMKQRAHVALDAKAAAFISIHFNSTPAARGPVAIVQATSYQGKAANSPAQWKRDCAMGMKLSSAIATVSNRYLPGTKARPSADFQAKPEGSHLFRYLRETPFGRTMEGCFLEIDFMDNPQVAAWLLESPEALKRRHEIAAVIAQAIINHLLPS